MAWLKKLISGLPFGKKKSKVGKFERLTEQVDAIPVKKEFSTGNEFDVVAGPSGYPNIKYPSFDQNDFELTSSENRNIFTLYKKRLFRKKKIFTFYSCELCGEYCSFSSKGFRSHRVTVHKNGVQKERTWDRFGHPFEPPETETPPAPEMNPNELDEQRQLEWALKDSALMYAAKYGSDD